MFHLKKVKVIAIQLLAVVTLLPDLNDCLIITSVLAGDKKFKTVSFHTKLLPPLKFEKEMPLTEFRRHRTMKPPKFDIDINIPIKLPIEGDYYTKEEPYKPVVSDFFFQSGHDVPDTDYGAKPQKHYGYQAKKAAYKEEPYAAAAASTTNSRVIVPAQSRIQSSSLPGSRIRRNSADVEPVVDQQSAYGDQATLDDPSRAETKDVQEPQQQQPQQRHQHQQVIIAQEASEPEYSQTARKGYDQQSYQNNGDYTPEFIPGGYVNLQLSGPVGGPKPTYEDFDREKWAQQLSQAPGAMPYPILNYQQLQNFYGGLGTFTNGLVENRYESHGLLEKLKSGISHFANKLHLGFSH